MHSSSAFLVSINDIAMQDYIFYYISQCEICSGEYECKSLSVKALIAGGGLPILVGAAKLFDRQESLVAAAVVAMGLYQPLVALLELQTILVWIPCNEGISHFIIIMYQSRHYN